MKINLGLGIFLLGCMIYAQTPHLQTSNYKATDEKKTALQHTKLKVSFDFNQQTLSGEAWLTAVPYFYATDSLILDAQEMQIHEVKIGHQDLLYNYNNQKLKIKLDQVYTKEQPYTVYIKYTAQPEEVQRKLGPSIDDAKGLYFIDPKDEDPERPTQVWTQGETQHSSVWFPTIDSPNQKTTQEIYMTVPDKYLTLSNGILKSSEKTAPNLRTDYWVMDKPHAPYLFFMAVGDFAKVDDGAWRNKVPISYYVEKEYASVAQRIFGNTKEMLEFYSTQFNYEFPWPTYNQVVVRDFVAGAMENTTAVSFMESAQQSEDVLADYNYIENIIAHEMAHHWFGNLVTMESWANLSLSESFANYSEYLWIEHKYGKDDADKHMKDVVEQYLSRPTEFDKELIRFHYDDHNDMFDLVSYNKGGAILHMLRNYLGDDAFFEGLSRYLHTYAFGTSEFHQLRLSLEQVSGKDLNWFFNQWYLENGHPEVTMVKNYDKQNRTLTLSIFQNQKEALFEFPLEIDIYENENAQRHKVWINSTKENTFTFSLKQEPKLVNINPTGVILMQEDYFKTPWEMEFQMKNAKDFKSRFQALQWAEENNHKPILLLGLKDNQLHNRIIAVNGLSHTKLTPQEWKEIENMAKNDPENLVKSAAMWTLSTSKQIKYLPIFKKGLSSPSASIKNAAIHGVSILAPEEALPLLLNAHATDFTPDQLIALSPVIVAHQLEKYVDALLSNFVLYPSLEIQGDTEKASVYRKGYIWAMQLDRLDWVEKVAETMEEMAPYEIKGSATSKEIIAMLNLGISIKKQLPQTDSIRKQIAILEKVLQKY